MYLACKGSNTFTCKSVYTQCSVTCHAAYTMATCWILVKLHATSCYWNNAVPTHVPRISNPSCCYLFAHAPVPSSSTLHPFSITRRGPLSFFEEPGQAEIKRPNEGSRQRVEAERVRRGSMHRDKEIRSVSGLTGVAKKWISTGWRGWRCRGVIVFMTVDLSSRCLLRLVTQLVTKRTLGIAVSRFLGDDESEIPKCRCFMEFSARLDGRWDKRGWSDKFRNDFRGVWSRDEKSLLCRTRKLKILDCITWVRCQCDFRVLEYISEECFQFDLFFIQCNGTNF